MWQEPNSASCSSPDHPSMVSSSPDADNPLDPSVHYPLINSHPLTYSSMPLHMYPLTPNTQRSFSTKRRQVKNACTNCQRACKKCDDCRPCLRCVKYGVPAECVDSQRKERKKGVKRGPYKKRDCKGMCSSSYSPSFYNEGKITK